MKWYNVKEYVPMAKDTGAGWGYYESKPIIVTDGKLIDIGTYYERIDDRGIRIAGWWECDPRIDVVTHWMSLPRLPEGE